MSKVSSSNGSLSPVGQAEVAVQAGQCEPLPREIERRLGEIDTGHVGAEPGVLGEHVTIAAAHIENPQALCQRVAVDLVGKIPRLAIISLAEGVEVAEELCRPRSGRDALRCNRIGLPERPDLLVADRGHARAGALRWLCTADTPNWSYQRTIRAIASSNWTL